MPINMSSMDVYKVVLQAWSVRQRVYNKFTHRFDWDYVGEFGFVYCKPCTQGGIQYCMKYMRKESDVPKGCKRPFIYPPAVVAVLVINGVLIMFYGFIRILMF